MTTPNRMSAMPVQTQQTAVVKRHPKHLEVMADRLKTDPTQLYQTLKQTVFKNATDVEFLALMVVANQYDLNPLLKELYAFPQKGGGIAPIVAVDGWSKIINRQEQLDGIEFEMEWTDQAKSIPFSCTCSIYAKGKSRPVKVTEYYGECFRVTEPWKNMPCRMLRHKALIQCARVAFGLSGIYDEDEARDIINVNATVSAPPPSFIGPGSDVPQGTIETHRHTAEDDQVPGAEAPAKPSKTVQEPSGPQGGSLPTSEPENASQSEGGGEKQASSAFVDVPAALVDGIEGQTQALTGDALLGKVQETLKASGVSGEQLTKWAHQFKMLKADQGGWSAMSEAKLRNVLKKWSQIGPNAAKL